MKTSTSIRLAVAGVISLASMAQAQSVCAINCFQGVITDHPPLDCTEENMYLCFCKRSNLQNWFAECIWDECGSQSEAAIAFGVNLCAGEYIELSKLNLSNHFRLRHHHHPSYQARGAAHHHQDRAQAYHPGRGGARGDPG